MNKIEQYLARSLLSYEEVGENIWLVNDEKAGLLNVVIDYSEPLVIVHTKVMSLADVPAVKREAFFRKLLELNDDLLHGAYAIETGDDGAENIILQDTLEYQFTEYEELRASLDAMSLALAQHYHILSEFRQKTTKNKSSQEAE